MADSTRRSPGRAGRHLAAVPGDPQPPLWDTGELQRLAYLRRLAIDSGQPAQAIRLIEQAATAAEAVEALITAGLMPAEDESLTETLSWFTPLLEPGCDQLDADVAGSHFIATLRQWASADTDVTQTLLALIGLLDGHNRPEALTVLRVLSATGPGEARKAATDAASRMVGAGLPDPPWAAGLGSPKPGASFGYEDAYAQQRSVVITFSYGRREHALVTLIDDGLGGGIKDCYACDYTERLRAEYRSLGQDPAVRFTDYDAAQARAILEEALSRPPCPADPGQPGEPASLLELLRARLALLPDASGHRAPVPSAAARRRPGGARNIHRLKVTLRGTRPPIWRRFEVPSDISLQRLHSVIQAGFGWEDCHLHVFETPAGSYGNPDPDNEIRSSAHKRLSAVADWPGDRIRYVYDFGDCWDHDIVVETVQPAEPGVRYPRCTAGRRAGPPEDCGGVRGYYGLLEALAGPRHDEHDTLLGRLGIASAAEFDPGSFDRESVNAALARIARVLARP